MGINFFKALMVYDLFQSFPRGEFEVIVTFGTDF